MKIENMILFVEVAQFDSFNKAAKGICRTQQGITSAVSRLESELGVSLFHRNSHGISLTEAGKTFLNCSQSIVGQYNKMLDQLEQSKLLQAEMKPFSIYVSSYVSQIPTAGIYELSLIRPTEIATANLEEFFSASLKKPDTLFGCELIPGGTAQIIHGGRLAFELIAHGIVGVVWDSSASSLPQQIENRAQLEGFRFAIFDNVSWIDFIRSNLLFGTQQEPFIKMAIMSALLSCVNNKTVAIIDSFSYEMLSKELSRSSHNLHFSPIMFFDNPFITFAYLRRKDKEPDGITGVALELARTVHSEYQGRVRQFAMDNHLQLPLSEF